MEPLPQNGWYRISNEDEVASPALLIYPERVQENIEALLKILPDKSRLRPHVKTNKMRAIIEKHLAAGIKKFKCATIAEAELLAISGAPDVLIAYQLVGPNLKRYCELIT